MTETCEQTKSILVGAWKIWTFGNLGLNFLKFGKQISNHDWKFQALASKIWTGHNWWTISKINFSFSNDLIILYATNCRKSRTTTMATGIRSKWPKTLKSFYDKFQEDTNRRKVTLEYNEPNTLVLEDNQCKSFILFRIQNKFSGVSRKIFPL